MITFVIPMSFFRCFFLVGVYLHVRVLEYDHSEVVFCVGVCGDA